MSEKRIPLAEHVIREIGGAGRGAAARTARTLGIAPSTVSKWEIPKARDGRGGDIPGWLKPIILEIAKERNLDITAEDLVRGYRKVSA